MKIAAVTRFKNGALFVLLQKLGWTQSELARRCGIDCSRISDFCTLKRKPSEDCANKIQAAFGEAGEYLDVLEAWPEGFIPLKKALVVNQIKEVELDALQYAEHIRELQEFSFDQIDNGILINELIPVLTDKEKFVIEHRFGINGNREHSLSECGKELHLERERVRQLENKAIRKLRNEYAYTLCDSLESARHYRLRRSIRAIPKSAVAQPKIKAPKKRKRVKRKHSPPPSREWDCYPRDAENNPFNIYVPDLVRTVKRPRSLVSQIESGMTKRGFARVSVGTFVKCDGDEEVTIRTIRRDTDDGVYYLLVSRR